jgi:predicted lipid-binding transport protein (Tim44 family)
LSSAEQKDQFMSRHSRVLSVALAGLAALSLSVGQADARIGGSKSSGSRGTMSTTPPAATPTAPKPAAPMERSATPAPKQTAGAATAGAAAAAPAGRGMMGGLMMGGLMGLGLAGLFGGFGAMGAMFGMILQIALLAGLGLLAYNFFRSRNQAAVASGPAMSANANRDSRPQQGNMTGGYTGGGAASNASYNSSGPAAKPAKLNISAADFDMFQTMLTKAQLSYGRQDRAALPFLATPEMVSYFNDDLDADAAQGVRNDLSDVKLLQGDLSEAWVESDAEFATVAMRYALRDAKIDIKTGRVVSGSTSELQEATEIWTFRRPRGAATQAWRISAIQQTT